MASGTCPRPEAAPRLRSTPTPIEDAPMPASAISPAPSPRLRRALRAGLALAACASAPALAADAHIGGHDVHCDVQSAYSLDLAGEGLRFHRTDGTPREVRVHDGRLWIDGAAAEVDPADALRLRALEDGVAELVPQAMDVAREGVAIAFDALEAVATGLSDAPAPMLAQLEGSRARIDALIDGYASAPRMDDAAIQAQVDAIAEELVPMLVAEVTRAAVGAALSGDAARAEALGQRAERMGEEIERLVEPRAEALAVRAQALCDQVAELDALESGLAWRGADGAPLDLLQAGAE